MKKSTESSKKIEKPWGYYQNIQLGEKYQIKILSVDPGQQLSLQKHRYRAEHWTVVQGSAEVILGEEKKKLLENQSIYINFEEKHRLRNPGKEKLVVVEVQYGNYLGEDDIVRFEDEYGRN